MPSGTEWKKNDCFLIIKIKERKKEKQKIHIHINILIWYKCDIVFMSACVKSICFTLYPIKYVTHMLHFLAYPLAKMKIKQTERREREREKKTNNNW